MADLKGLHVATHPLIAHKMTLLRDKRTASHDFRRLLKEITFYLGFEASRDLTLTPIEVVTPLAVHFHGSKLAQDISIIPILRAGIGMEDGLLELMPRASVHHIGMYRNKSNFMPVQYYNKLPKDHPCDVAFICDPCIATSNSLCACVQIVKQWGAKQIIVIAAVGCKEGVRQLLEKHPDIHLHMGALDDELSSAGMIVPGIGDAGDRQFGTPIDDDHMPQTAAVTADDRGKRSRSDSLGGDR